MAENWILADRNLCILALLEIVQYETVQTGTLRTLDIESYENVSCKRKNKDPNIFVSFISELFKWSTAMWVVFSPEMQIVLPLRAVGRLAE